MLGVTMILLNDKKAEGKLKEVMYEILPHHYVYLLYELRKPSRDYEEKTMEVLLVPLSNVCGCTPRQGCSCTYNTCVWKCFWCHLCMYALSLQMYQYSLLYNWEGLSNSDCCDTEMPESMDPPAG